MRLKVTWIFPFVVSLSNHERLPFDKLRAIGITVHAIFT